MTTATAAVPDRRITIGGRAVRVRPAERPDMVAVIGLDERTTGLRKPDYWDDLFARYAERPASRFFLVAQGEDTGRLLGCILGQVRAWEFNSVPCGWVVTVSVAPDWRMSGIGGILYEAMCDCFRTAGVDRVRTMIARDNTDLMAFFRSRGMMAGPFVQLETDLD